MKNYNVGILGATGAVGREMLNSLMERNFPVGELRLLASKRSVGKKIKFNGKDIEVVEAKIGAFKGLDIVLGAASNDIAKEFKDDIVASGAVFIDNSSAFRLDENVPLVVPEINGEDVFKNHGVISNPNCSTIITLMALKAINKLSEIKTVVASTYQAVSGIGVNGPIELMDEMGVMNDMYQKSGEPVIDINATPKHFPYQIAGNCIPFIGSVTENGYTKEEMKMIWETKKILGDQSIKVTATTVRVPVLNSHSESINLEFKKPVTKEGIIAALKTQEHIIIMDDPANNVYPMPILSTGHDEVYVGRIRLDDTVESGCNLWVCADNIRKGAASNAVQIAEYMIKNNKI
jgi:aspartate-semialdehyde dehydrogenase